MKQGPDMADCLELRSANCKGGSWRCLMVISV